jgi:hypothetical protein
VTSDPPELGKGIFGYRKSAVNQILADRDIMLRQAEGRVRAAESKVAELESELVQMRDRNSRMDDQLDRLRTQLDALAGRVDMAVAAPLGQDAEIEPPAASEAHPDPISAWQPDPSVVDEGAEPPAEHLAFAESDAEFSGLDDLDAAGPEPDFPTSLESEPAPETSIFGEPDDQDAGLEPTEVDYAPPAEPSPWLEQPAEAGQDADDLIYGSTDYSYEPAESFEPESGSPAPQSEAFEASEETQDETQRDGESFSFPYDAGQFGQEIDELDEVDELDELPPVMTFEGGTSASNFEADMAPPAAGWEQTEAEAEATAHALAEAAAAAAAAAEEQAEAEYEPLEISEPAPEPATDEAIPSFAESSVAPAEPPAAEPVPAATASGVSPETIDLTNRFLTDEIQGILAAAEESAARIVERARATTQHQIAQSNRLWREVQAEVSRFATWREQVEPVIRAVQSKVQSVRSQIDEVPERIRQALAPMADSISNVDADLAELAAASSPPLLLTPRGLDAESEQEEAWGAAELLEEPVEEADGSAEGEDGASGHLAG